MKYNPECTDCPLHENAQTVCMPGIGDKNPDILIIGESPRGKDDKTGIPFSGEPGVLLKRELEDSKLRSIYYTNLIKCTPKFGTKIPAAAVKACRKYLDREIEELKPEWIATLGSLTSKSVLKKAKITEAHGQVVDLKGRKGMPLFDPGYAIRDPSKMPTFQADIRRLARATRDELKPTEVDWDWVRVETLEEFMVDFYQAEVFSFDLETSGLFPHNEESFIRCIGFGFWHKAWVIPLDMVDQGSGRPLYDNEIAPFTGRKKAQVTLMDWLFETAERLKKRAVAQNGKFDNIWLLRKFGRRFRLFFDTMLASHTLDENVDHDLKTQARNNLDIEEYDITTREKQGFTTPKRLYKYCAKDAFYTLQLYPIYSRQLKEVPELRRLFYKLVMPAARAFEMIELRGLTIDLKKMKEVEDQMRMDLNRTHQELDRLVKKKVKKKVNWNSPAQVAKLLFEDLKLKATVFTDSGAPSTGEEALLNLKGQHPILDLLITFREKAKFLSTYIEGFRELMIGDKLYISFKLHGTVTGRYSSRIHSIPRDGSIRNLVTAPTGWTFVQGDLATAEMRVAGILSMDPELIYCFKNNIDVHWRTLLNNLLAGAAGEYVKAALDTAKKISGKTMSLTDACELMLKTGHEKCTEIWKGWKEARKRAKAVNFGFIYGMYENKFIETCKMKYGFEPTLEEATDSRNAYFALYQGLKPWHNRQKSLVKLDGFVRNLAGRRRRLSGIHSKDWSVKSECERQAINSPVQGYIGDHKAMAVVEIEETIPHGKFRLVGEHHDAILGIVRNDCIDEILPKVRSIMRRPKLIDEFKIDLPIPIEADLELGNWGAGKAYKGDLNASS